MHATTACSQNTQTCCNHLAGSTNAGINTQVGCEGMSTGDLARELGDAGARLCVLTVCMARLAIADVDVVDVGVGLQSEDEADQVRSREQHRNSVHQRSVKDVFFNGHDLENLL